MSAIASFFRLLAAFFVILRKFYPFTAGRYELIIVMGISTTMMLSF